MVNKSGFSLIELVVVIGLLSLLILAITSTSLMSVISSNRIRTTTKVKQAGNYALDQISTLIRNSKAITACDDVQETLTLINQNGDQTTFSIENDKIASNSGTYLTPDNLSVANFDFTCLPDTTNPNFIKLSFDLKETLIIDRQSSNPTLHFETSTSLRNE